MASLQDLAPEQYFLLIHFPHLSSGNIHTVIMCYKHLTDSTTTTSLPNCLTRINWLGKPGFESINLDMLGLGLSHVRVNLPHGNAKGCQAMKDWPGRSTITTYIRKPSRNNSYGLELT